MIDILLATYQGEEYVEEQIDSIKNQSMQDFRLIIRDDASSDGTRDILDGKVKEFDANQAFLLSDTKHLGSASASFMRLLSMSHGDYAMFADQDDLWSPYKLEMMSEKMKKLEWKYGKATPILIHTDLQVIDANGNVLAESFYKMQKLPMEDNLNLLLIQNTVTGCTIMMNKSAVNLLKKSRAEDMLMHDHYAAILVAALGKVIFMKEPLVRYRQHGDNSVGAKSASSPKELLRRLLAGKATFQKMQQASYKQADAIYRTYANELAANKNAAEMIKAYGSLTFATGREKRKVFKKYKIYKNGLWKREVQKIWC